MAQNPHPATFAKSPEGSQSDLAATAHALDLAGVGKVVTTIKRLQAKEATVDLEILTETAAAFDGICKDASRRLNKISTFLSAGNLAAALDGAETSPALPDVLQLLAVPDAKAWNAMLAKHRCVPPPPLNPRQMKQLEEAYAAPEALVLLRKMFDAPQFAHAATLERIAAARRMRTLDRGNPDWITRLAALELRRQNDILALVTGRMASNLSLQDAGELVAELKQSTWLVLPPQKLIEEAQRFLNAIRQQELTETLDVVLDRILEAREKRDYAGLEKIVKHIRTLSDDAGIPPGQLEAIREAREWLAQQNENFHQQLNELELLLDDLAPSRQIRYVLREIEDTGRTLPPILFQRTTSYLAQHDVGEQRRSRQLRILLVVIALAVVGVAAWLVINKA